MKDEGVSEKRWTFAIAVQVDVANRLAVLWTKSMVLNGQGKGTEKCQVKITEMNSSKPLMTY
jgi:hypothetical protein